MEQTTVTLTKEQLGILIDSVHDRFMSIVGGREAHPPAGRKAILNELSQLQAILEAAEKSVK